MSCRNTFKHDVSHASKCETYSQQYQMPVGWLSSVWDQQYEVLEQVI